MQERPEGAIKTINELQEILRSQGHVYGVEPWYPDVKIIRKLTTEPSLKYADQWNLDGIPPHPKYEKDYLFKNYWVAWGYACKMRAKK